MSLNYDQLEKEQQEEIEASRSQEINQNLEEIIKLLRLISKRLETVKS